MRGAVWAEVFLPLFGEVVFLGLWVTVLGLRWLCLGVMRAHWNDFHGYLVDPVENGLGKSLIHEMMLRADCPLMKAVTK